MQNTPAPSAWKMHIANGLSFLRALCTLPVVLFSLMASFIDPMIWWFAFAWVAFGWLTDTVDGWAARRWKSPTYLWKKHVEAGGDRQSFMKKYQNGNRIRDFSVWFSTQDPDGAADTILAFITSLVPVVYILVTTHNKWAMMLVTILVLIYLASIAMGLLMVKAVGQDPESRSQDTQLLVYGNMMLFHGLFQIGFTIMWFAFMAGGWTLAIPTLLVLVFVAWKQQPKMRLWQEGRLTARV